ncbi:MAG: sigma-70 family RNA polymerase sigma factor [Planctomycetes bacterium]|nr:sigma-70 family RNA polymerase sigma factor [Planctomycetota bacterium]
MPDGRGVRKDDRRSGLEALVRTHGAQALAVARQFAATDADAEDIVQDALVQAWRRWDTFRGDAARSTWLHTIVTRMGLKRLAKRRRRQRLAPTFSAVSPFGDRQVIDLPDRRGSASIDRILDGEALAQMRTAMLMLPAPWRAALVLRDVAGLEADDAAHALGIGVATLKTRLHRGRLALRKAMMAHLPLRAAPAPIYERQTCAELLQLKLQALEDGRMTPKLRAVACDRCRSVFRELDLASASCDRLFIGTDRAAIKARITAVLARLSTPASMHPDTARSTEAVPTGSRVHRSPSRRRTPGPRP